MANTKARKEFSSTKKPDLPKANKDYRLPEPETILPNSARALFGAFTDQRVIDSAHVYAHLTNPAIFNRNQQTDRTGIRKVEWKDHQSLGSLLVNNLAAKTSEMLLPINSSFFKIEPTPVMQRISQEQGVVTPEEQSAKFASLEREASSRAFLNGGYSELNRAIQLLIVCGNALLFRDSVTKSFVAYDVNQYRVDRDGRGKVRYIVLREYINVADLTTEQLQKVNITASTKDILSTVAMYTVVERVQTPAVVEMDNGTTAKVMRYGYKIRQEINDLVLADEGYVPESECPYIVLTWRRCTGENYGRGHVEDYVSDLSAYSAYAQKSFEYTAAMLKFVNLVPASLVPVEDLLNADNGEYIPIAGTNTSPAQVLEGGQANKLQQVQSEMQLLEQRLYRAFMYTGVQRDAERVTAEEIRTQIREAEFTLGQAYANISTELHPRLAAILISEIDPDTMDLIAQQAVTLDVAVGLSSLNRSATVTRLQYASNAMQLTLPVFAQASPRFNIDAIIDVILDGFGVDKTTIMLSQEELQAKIAQQQQQMQEQAQQLQTPDPNVTGQQLGLN